MSMSVRWTPSIVILLGCAVYVVCGIRAGVADTMLVTHDRFARDFTVTPRQGVLDTATLRIPVTTPSPGGIVDASNAVSRSTVRCGSAGTRSALPARRVSNC
ncbi:MAG TPA: hypothetical protein VMH39_07480 [Gemmatimonadaceae bacterium]|nr:hypothetical protein [Gemmatimonadaceae bacterium]